MTSFVEVVGMLDASVGGADAPVGVHGPFWRGISRDQFVAKKVLGLPLLVIGQGAASNLVKALKGEAPFGRDLDDPPPGARFPRMPFGFDPVADADIARIEKWIDDGCPAGSATMVNMAAAVRPAAVAAERRWRPTNAPIASSRTDDVFFLDPDIGWAVNSNGHILHTRDGGGSWTRQFEVQAYFRCIGFADAQHGWAGTLTTPRRLFSTKNGGQDWTQVANLPADAPVRICGLSVVDASTVYASGTNDPRDEPRMMKTTDGGQTWSAWSMRPFASILIDTHFLDKNRGWVVGGKAADPNARTRDQVKPVVLFTEDGGRTWTDRLAGREADFPLGEWGWKIQFVDDRVVFVSLENFTAGAILKSLDGGATWQRLKVNDAQGNANLEGIGFIDATHGWVGGWGDADFMGGFSSATDDGGATWRNANEIGRFVNRFRFFGRPVTLGYASGETVYKYSAEPVRAPVALVAARAAPALLQEQRLVAEALPAEIPAVIPVGSQRLRVEVFDRFGLSLGLIADETDPTPGERRIVWDGRDPSGGAVADGAYIFRVTADQEAESGILKLRRT
jgi:photosystem II stability/assembly factor-like uncharacterized protein